MDSRILVIDDEYAPRELAKQAFMKWKLDVATSGAEGIKIFKNLYNSDTPPDIVLVDWMMPVIDGYEVVKEIRMLDSEVFIFVWSVIADKQEIISLAMEAGADDVLYKQTPSPEELELRVIQRIRNAKERKNRETKARQEELENTHTLLATLPQGVFQTDEIENIIWINDALCRITEYSKEELLKINVFNLFHPDDHPLLTAQIANRLKGEISSYAIRIITRSNIAKTVLIHASPRSFENGNFTGSIAVVSEITSKKRVIEQMLGDFKKLRELALQTGSDLAAFAEYWKIVLDAMPIAFFSTDLDRRITKFNKAAIELCGTTNLYGKRLCDYLHDCRSDKCPFVSGEIIKEPFRFEWERKNAEGSSEFFTILLIPMGNRNGVIEDIVHIVIDKTIEKQAVVLAENASKEKSNFLANMSHEIRTPLNAILGFLELLKDTTLTPQQVSYVEKILTATEMLLTVINDILDVSKIESGQLTLEKIPFDLMEIMRQLATLVSLRAQKKGLEILFNFDRNLPIYLIGDPHRLLQVLLNLAYNAIKFTEKGEIVISIGEVSHIEKKDLTIQFSVQDTGIGMAPEVMKRLFKRFSQGDDSITRKYGGTGLGLLICDKLVDMMGGSFSVKSEVGKGSKFSFSIPLSLQSGKEYIPSDNTLFVEKKALVADDSPTARVIHQQLLESFSIKVETVKNGKRALEELHKAAIKGEPFDFAFLDLIMPGMDGLQVAAEIRNDILLTDTKIIIVTANRWEELPQEKKQMYDIWLSKPITPSDLFNALLTLMGKPLTTRLFQRTSTWKETNLSKINGALILVAEDNVLNQELITELLKKAGLRIVVANNGKEALDILEKTLDIELILMDVQMPEMDGREATKKIREKEKISRNLNPIPIIALTAHALRGEEEKCLEAGMNDYISKPLDPAILFEMLQKYLLEKERKKITIEDTQDSESQTELPEIYGIDTKEGLYRTSGDQNLFSRLLGIFYNDFQNTADAVRVALEKKSFEEVKQIAHKIKGAAGNIGAQSVFSIAGTIEEMAGKELPNTNRIKKKTTELESELNQVRTAIQMFLETQVSKKQEQPPMVMDDETYKKRLDSLKIFLQQYDMQAENIFNEIESLLKQKMLSLVEKLGKQIKEFDFDEAWETLKSVMNQLEIMLEREKGEEL